MNRTVVALIFACFLVAIRALYVWMETAYNIALLDLVSTELMTTSQAESVQALGHKLAAIGVALLATPLLIVYSVKGVAGLGKRWAVGSAFGVMGFVSIYIAAFHAQTFVMDSAVESTAPETRYEAYYGSLFRQLYIDGNVVDNGFVPDTKTAAQTMWLPFAVSEQIDLPENLRTDAGDIVFERAQKQLALERFERDYASYSKYQAFTKNFISDYRAISEEADAKEAPSESSAVNLYGSIVESIYQAQTGYDRVSTAYRAHLNFLRENGFFLRDVRTLFSGSENERLWRHSVLLKNMQIETQYLSVDDWCAQSRCPGSSEHIRKVIRSALASKYKAVAGGVPMGLSTREFLASHHAFNFAMQKTGIPVTFNRSPVTFSRFESMVDPSILRPNVAPLMAKRYPDLQGLTLPSGLSDQALIESAEFKRFVTQELGSRVANLSPTLTKDEFFLEWMKGVSNELEQNRSVLLPASPAQMENKANIESGYSAVRLLYIPPIAAALSAIMLLLNVAAIVSNVFAHGAFRWGFRICSLFGLLLAGYVVGGTAGMPTEITGNVWDAYQAQSPLGSVFWQFFFGVEFLIASAADTTDIFISPEALNGIIERGMGWAL